MVAAVGTLDALWLAANDHNGLDRVGAWLGGRFSKVLRRTLIVGYVCYN